MQTLTIIKKINNDQPKPEEEISLAAGGEAASMVVRATEDTGRGTWLTRWFPSENAEGNLNDNVTLEIPAGAATLGNNTATITWTLTAGPG